MRSKPVQWLLAAVVLLCAFSVPGWAQPELVGEEFQVNQNNNPRQLNPQVAFSPSGNALVVWENDRHGILGRTYDRNGNATSAELVLVANKNLAGIPAQGEVLIRKEPSLIYLPSGEFLVFWTEEKDFLVLDHFYERRVILDQDVYGQRFSAAGAPLGERIRVNATTAELQRRPKAAIKAGGLVVVWESANRTRNLDSLSISGRLLTRRGVPAGAEFRIDAGTSPEVWNPEVAANASGEFLVVWEAGAVDAPDVFARLYDRDGAPSGSEFTANPTTLGRQRRPAVLATRNGDFLVAWQSYVSGGSVHGINGQLYGSNGARIGSELKLSVGTGQVQISPALALLPSGNIVVTWMDWVNTWPIGLYAVLIDSSGRTLGNEQLISEERLFPQYQTSVAANVHGEILAAWEGRMKRERAITARLMQAD